MLNLFVALLVNAFDFRDVDEAQTADPAPLQCPLKKMLQTHKSRLYVVRYREPLRLYELQVLESSCSRNQDAGALAICHPGGGTEEPCDANYSGASM